MANALQNGLPPFRCFGLRGNVREEINIDGVADAPSGVLKIDQYRDVSPRNSYPISDLSVSDADPTAPDIFADKFTGFVERISTHADDCVVTMQVNGNEILLRDRNICCKMHAQVSFLLAQKMEIL